MRQKVTEEQIRQAKSVDLLSYMRQYDPRELIRTGPHDYKTATHSSLCISDNGLWHWFSRGIGGRGALNYLIQVKGMDFVSAVRHLCELDPLGPVPFQPVKAPERARDALALPVPDKSAETSLQYLSRRGIDKGILKHCIAQGLLYQTTRGGFKNCVFVGRDRHGNPRSACIRGCQGSFRGECRGSDKRYSFSIPAASQDAATLEVYEAPIDALSGATLRLLGGNDWRRVHYLALGGLNYLGLDHYLEQHPEIRNLRLRLDSDERGREFSERLLERYAAQGYRLQNDPPRVGKDYNEYLTAVLSRAKAPRQTR